MADGSIARRYAKALIALAQEANLVEKLGADLTGFAGVLEAGNGELRDVLSNPGVPITERTAVIDAVVNKLSLQTHTGNFLRLLVDKNRFDLFADIVRSYTEMADELAGRVRATVTTADKLDAVSAAKVKAALAEATGKDVEVLFETDAELIGGVVARIGDTVYDASIRARLEDLAGHLVRDPSHQAS